MEDKPSPPKWGDTIDKNNVLFTKSIVSLFFKK